MNKSEEKKALRKFIIEMKNKLNKTFIHETSDDIIDKLMKTEAFINSNIIMCYLSFGTEVDTTSFIQKSIQLGKTILIPVILKKSDGTSLMECSELINIEQDLAPGTLGIMEPKKEALRIKDPSIIDLIIIPGLAFDRYGNRLGYGAGYYDYFIPRLQKDCIQIALCFTNQVVDKIPTQDHDIKINNILTEQDS